MFPDVSGQPGLCSGAFLSCSADNTIKVWRMEDSPQTPFWSPNILSTVSLILWVYYNVYIFAKDDYSVHLSLKGPAEHTVCRWKHSCLVGSRVYNKCQCR